MDSLRWAARALVLGVAMVGCAVEPESGTDVALPVLDLRDPDDTSERSWDGDTLIVDTACLDLRALAGATLDDACDELFGGRAHVGEDRIAATIFDDPECRIAAGFLPPPGLGGEVRVPRRGAGIILRCAVEAEPR